MSSLCRPGLLLALLALAAAAAAKVPATWQIAPFDCSGEVCGFIVTADARLGAPCEGRSVLVAYSRTGGATLVQCSAPDRSEDNLLYAFNRSSSEGQVYELDGGRYVNLSSLAQAATDGIPDRFGPVPLCRPPGTAHAGELTVIVKEPDEGGEHPYCYRLYRALTASGAIEMTADGTSAPAPSSGGRARWSKLVAALRPYLAPAAAAQAPAAVVGATKARLYTRPDKRASTRMYLIRGDAVSLLDASPCAGWSRIRYVTQAGKTLDSWIRSADLAN
jgi:hypothetical protein